MLTDVIFSAKLIHPDRPLFHSTDKGERFAQRIFSVIYIHEYRVHMIKRGKLYLRQTRNKSCFVQGYFHLNPFMDKRKKKRESSKDEHYLLV